MNIGFWLGSKMASIFRHPAAGGIQSIFLRNFGNQTAGKFNYSRAVGTGLKASVVMAPIQWIQRSMPEAPLIVERDVGNGEWEQIEHPLTALVDQPNPFYSGAHLWAGTLFSYLTDGNAYWIIIKSNGGKPAQLWYAPHWMMRPVVREGSEEFLTGYEYKVGGKITTFEPEEVAHFRHGINPENLRLGVSPIISALSEIFTDMEAAEFIASLLRNNAIPGLILNPKNEGAQLGPNDPKEIKSYVMDRTTGSRRGEPLVFSEPTNVERLSWSPKEMDLTPASDRSEERVCALYGIPAAVVGFSAGLQQTKVGATMAEMRKLAWQNGIFPLHRTFSSELDRGLLEKYGKEHKHRTRFDTSEVAALQEDRRNLTISMDRGIRGGWVTIAEGKRALGMTALPEDEIYLRGANVVAVAQGEVHLTMENPEKGFKEHGTLFEHRIAETSTRVAATDKENAFISHHEGMAPRLEKMMEKRLAKIFTSLGKEARESALEVLEEEIKASLEDQILVSSIIQGMNMVDAASGFSQAYGDHYLDVLQVSTGPGMSILGISTNIPDDVARSIHATGGTRAGLVDLTKQTKDALFDAIAESRALGEGAAQLADRIASTVGSGPWSTAEIRAMVIARTETKHAQRVSALAMGKANGATEFRVFDARLGASDPTCESLDGILVSFQDAAHLANEEHPNGTRDFVPHF